MSGGCRPRLAAKARLRHDRQTGGWLLLYPERGLALGPTAAEIVRLLTGEHTVDTIVDRLATAHGAPREVVAADVHRFLEALSARALVVEAR
jgi:pyrroloquinoline quinone biosynthesis protein D